MIESLNLRSRQVHEYTRTYLSDLNWDSLQYDLNIYIMYSTFWFFRMKYKAILTYNPENKKMAYYLQIYYHLNFI